MRMQWVTKLNSHTWGLIAAVVCLTYGAIASNFLACVLALALVGIFGKQAWQVRQSRPAEATSNEEPSDSNQKPKRKRRRKKRKKSVSSASVATPKDYISKMIGQGRYAILLRDEVAGNIDESSVDQARTELKHMMSVVKGGEVQQRAGHPSDLIGPGDRAVATSAVDEFYIDRFAVTNEEFKRFVDDQGYQNDEYWAEDVRLVREELSDQTGHPGPRFWTNGSFAPGQGDHPVVGISWYEAEAYARWQGKRLPTDAEWTKAASAATSATGLPGHERKYPWGSSLSEGRANLWCTGIGATVSVEEFEDGDNGCQVRQLIGNVWEWSKGDFPGDHESSCWELEDEQYKTLRGGAFDTYFEHHATCHSKSADHPSARKHNVGFRCVVTADEISPS